jgi:CheY-like chemotaxis protein
LNYPTVNFITMETNNPSFQFLIVDDDSVNNMVCKAVIKSVTGEKNTICFNNPLEALKYFEVEKQIHPILLFLDLNMPEMNGWEWLERYRHLPDITKEKVNIYILSSSVNPTDIARANSHNLVTGYVVKPLTKVKVMNILQDINSKPLAELKKSIDKMEKPYKIPNIHEETSFVKKHK